MTHLGPASARLATPRHATPCRAPLLAARGRAKGLRRVRRVRRANRPNVANKPTAKPRGSARRDGAERGGRGGALRGGALRGGVRGWAEAVVAGRGAALRFQHGGKDRYRWTGSTAIRVPHSDAKADT